MSSMQRMIRRKMEKEGPMKKKALQWRCRKCGEVLKKTWNGWECQGCGRVYVK